jgi:hypothetical protein
MGTQPTHRPGNPVIGTFHGSKKPEIFPAGPASPSARAICSERGIVPLTSGAPSAAKIAALKPPLVFLSGPNKESLEQGSGVLNQKKFNQR